MNRKLSYIAVLSTIGLASTLTGCSGDGSGSSSVIETGVFLDAPVSGLYYETSTSRTGTTTDKGEFNFVSGDSVTFYVGGKTGLALGSAGAAATLTPLNLAKSSRIDDAAVSNMLLLLQNLDQDSNPENGINLTGVTVPAGCNLTTGVSACGSAISAANAKAHFLKTLAKNGDIRVTSVEFFGMDAPATADEKADMYSKAQMSVTYSNGVSANYDMRYHQIFATTDTVGGNMVGGMFNSTGSALADNDGQMASDAPDGTSLMKIDGLLTPGATGNSLAMVTQFEYKELPPNDGISSGGFWSKLPVPTGLALLDQNSNSGLLTAKKYQNVDFSGVNGGWIHCGSSLSGWNTHLSSEEYEPDAKVRGGGTKATGSEDGTSINSFSKYYFGNEATANPYHYGLVPEVTVSSAGQATVVKHHAPGRYAREMLIGADDNKTFIGGDDGGFTGLFMFVADKEKDLSAGTLYAAKVSQTGTAGAGSFNLSWIKLGSSSDAEIKAIVDGGIKFSDIFDVSNTDPLDSTYTKVMTYMGTEWLKLKPGKEKAAAFLETRRYAALLGATTEFNKMEYIAYNKADKKFYVTISRIEGAMSDALGDITGIARNDGGAVLEMITATGKADSSGNTINSGFVGTSLSTIPELVGVWSTTKDAEGNACDQAHICGPDNIVYLDAIRTLFIGEDTSRRNNNYVWAFNVDTKKLSRLLSTPMGAEATGLNAYANYNGFAYIGSNFQHPAEGDIPNYKGADKASVLAAINSKWGSKKKAAIGYLGTTSGALPRLQ